jgi:hypothetical protein
MLDLDGLKGEKANLPISRYMPGIPKSILGASGNSGRRGDVEDESYCSSV